jgi:TatD DNase family protein
MRKIIETHAHLDSSQYNEDRDSVINNCILADIKYIINPAVNFKSCQDVLNLAAKYEFFYICLGIHPHDSKEYTDNIMIEIEKMLGNKKVIGVGEIGLDYHYNYSPKDKQKEVFREFLKLAKKYKIPVVIHNRESDNDMLNILESEMNENLKGQLHCFSSDIDFAKRILEYNFFISFTGSITFSNRYNEVVNQVPIEKMLLETDSPYMSPVPHRGKRNDPTRLIYIIEKIAEIKNLDASQVIEITYSNAINLFNLIDN